MAIYWLLLVMIKYGAQIERSISVGIEIKKNSKNFNRVQKKLSAISFKIPKLERNWSGIVNSLKTL